MPWEEGHPDVQILGMRRPIQNKKVVAERREKAILPNQNHLSKLLGFSDLLLVPGGGVEPPRYQVPADFESAASASSAIPAGQWHPQVSTGLTATKS